MEVKKGFKQTDVGIIPEDWNIELLIQCCDYVDYRGKTPHKTSSGTFLITARNIRKGFIDYDISKEYVPTAEYDFTMSRGKPQLGDVIITTEAPLGNVAQIDREDVALAQRVIKYRPKNFRLSANYLKHYLLSERFQAILNSRSSGSTATGIKGSVLHQLPVVIPPLAEQEAFAEALSDADTLIEAVEQLLTKKRQVKQGAMSELLTGERRLPGFVGKWRSCELGELIAHCSSGATPYRGRLDYYKGTVKWITSGELNYNVITDTIEHISNEAVEKTNLKVHPVGTFLMAITGLEAAGTRGSCGIVGSPSTTNQSCMAIYPTPELKTEFLYHYYVLRGNELALKYCQGTKQQSYTAKLVKLLPIDIPPTVTEQTAIAEILSDMDAEISALEEKLVKARQVKAGMMSELLGGKIRLV